MSVWSDEYKPDEQESAPETFRGRIFGFITKMLLFSDTRLILFCVSRMTGGRDL